MRFLVDLFHALDRDMSVNLRGRETGVAEQGLHAAEVGPMIEEMSCETMAQLVRTRILRDVAEGMIFLK